MFLGQLEGFEHGPCLRRVHWTSTVFPEKEGCPEVYTGARDGRWWGEQREGSAEGEGAPLGPGYVWRRPNLHLCSSSSSTRPIFPLTCAAHPPATVNLPLFPVFLCGQKFHSASGSPKRPGHLAPGHLHRSWAPGSCWFSVWPQLCGLYF